MDEQIPAAIAEIERSENVRVLYAVESGSRAWGFPSRDSDYDVRFIYVRPVEAYLTIEPQRDVIERPISDALDINGWDLPKALGLFQRSNPALLEWLRSPIVYAERFDFAARLRALEPTYITHRSLLHHYLNLAKGQFNKYLQGERVPVKKYFYVLRPVLACAWLLERGTIPPLDFVALVRAQLAEQSTLTATILDLRERKMAGDELDDEPQIAELHTFVRERIAAYDALIKAMPDAPSRTDHAALDALFHALLEAAWGISLPRAAR